ncbi:MAG: choice-of-anchor J domain-containing protein [Ferruginibacter sp.]
MKKIYLLVILAIFSAGSFAQTVDILNTPGQSGSSVIGQSTYHVSESIYTNEEIGATNFTTAGTAIQKIGFFIDALGAPTSMNNFSVYMKNVPIGTTTLATGAYSTTGYTPVFAGTFNAPTAGLASIILTAPFTRTANTNLQVLIIRANNVLSTGYVAACAAGNTVGGVATPTALSSRRYNNTTAPASGVTSLTATNFRPAIELVHTFPVNASVIDIKLPTISCYSAGQTIGVEVFNEGTLNIAAGAVNATLHVSGANTFSGTATNSAIITAGNSGIINFTGINLSNVGDHLDSAWITLASDPDQSRDTGVTAGTTAPVLSTYPIIEDVEGTLPVFPWIAQITGDQLWTLQVGDYSNADQTVPLVARAPGTTSYLFDSYSGVSSLGFQSRLFSNCIQIPAAASTPTLTFWMSHDNVFPTDLDSMYVSISTDKGVTWNRINGYRRPDATATTPIWRQETINLSAYGNQTIQIGFEGVSKYGNAFSLDDINISVSGTNAAVDSIGLPNISCYSTPQTIAVRVANIGTSVIPAGTPVTLHVGGANTFAGTQNTAGAIAVGASTIVNFAGVNLSNPGTNFDTAYITLASDINHLNDTLTTGGFTAGVLSNYPIVEDVEGTLPVFPWVQQLNGDQLWTLQVGDYSNADQTVPLVARAPGTTSYLFDSYSGASSVGFASRLFSNCLQMPAAAANPTLTFWMSHDNYFPTDLDSMYVSISTDKGVTWNRINGYRRPDATATTPLWRQETINLTPYANQTIQIGFEGVSKYGNAFSLDDINISIAGANATIDSIGVPTVSCYDAPQTVVVRAKNIGSTVIAAGTASITLHISGANTFASTQVIGGAIPVGGTAQIDFTGIDLSNAGLNVDSAWVTVATDINHADDTAVIETYTASTLSSFPLVEDAETTFPVFNWLKRITGGEILWTAWTTPPDFPAYTDIPAMAPGNTFYVFDSYHLFSNPLGTSGTETRLFSNCIDLAPLNARLPIYDGALLTFWMTHDSAYSSIDPDGIFLDSLYVSVSTDKGQTWNRIAGFQRNDITLPGVVWRMESVDISAYVGQTIQIGFEGVSKFGNAIGLDNITIAGILPVSILNFDARRNGKVNELSWKTSMEQNSSKFIIERSIDGGHTYSEIGKVNAAGNSNSERNYRFTDATPTKGINYYRLRIVDIDNTFKYSIIRSVRNEGSADFSFAPNPVEPQMKVKLDADNADRGTITITDMSGKLVYSNTINVAAGHNEIIIETGKFSQGSYIIKLQLSNDRIVKKFTKL